MVSANHFFADEEKMCKFIQVPLTFLSSKWDPMERFQLLLPDPVVAHMAAKRFGSLTPGFWGAQANWSDPKQAKGASQAVLLAAAFLRHVLTPGGGGEWPVLSSRYMLLGRSNTGVKLVANAGFPWLEQIVLYKGHEKERAKEKERQEQDKRQQQEQERETRAAEQRAQEQGHGKAKEREQPAAAAAVAAPATKRRRKVQE